MRQTSVIYVAGHRGLAGSAILRALRDAGYERIVVRTHSEVDLTDGNATSEFFAETRPEYVFLAAAKVGGIQANKTFPVEFIHENILIQTNVLRSAYQTEVQRLVFLGSSCIYPRDCPQPIKEDYLLSGPLENTNRAYAIAKICGVEACWAYNQQYGTKFVALMPTNLYGPNDNYDLESSHVLPALLRKTHEAKIGGRHEVVVWGSGVARREFLHADDLGNAAVKFMMLPDQQYGKLIHADGPPLVNIGCGTDMTITELAQAIFDTVGFRGKLAFDLSKPDGTPQKLLDVTRARSLGWSANISLREGLSRTYADFLKRYNGSELGGQLK